MTRDLCIFLFFYFADDMGVCVFWVCPTTPMSSAGTIVDALWVITDRWMIYNLQIITIYIYRHIIIIQSIIFSAN